MMIRMLIALLLFATASFAQVSPEAKESAREEREQMDAQVDEDKLPIDISVLLGGKPFPQPLEYKNPTPAPKRRIEISDKDDLQAALRKLEPGDQLVLSPGAYEGSFTIDETCRNGTAEAPIQIFARGAVLRPAANSTAVLNVDRGHWSITGVQISSADSTATAVVLGGNAHDVILDHAHLYNGLGTGVRIQPGATRITIAGSHIHHFGRAPSDVPTGIVIEGGASEISVLGTHLHHNRGASIGVAATGDRRAKRVIIKGNKLHDDKSSAVIAAGADDVQVVGNKIYNYRPSRSFSGSAIRVTGGATNVTIETNHFAEASIGIEIDGAKDVVIRDNYLENRLTPVSTAFKVLSGDRVTIAENVVDRYRHALRTPVAVTFVKNVLIEPAEAAFDAERATIDGNLIGWNGLSLPGAKAIKGLDLKDRDLAAVKKRIE